jgi:hypothetical protein
MTARRRSAKGVGCSATGSRRGATAAAAHQNAAGAAPEQRRSGPAARRSNSAGARAATAQHQARPGERQHQSKRAPYAPIEHLLARRGQLVPPQRLSLVSGTRHGDGRRRRRLAGGRRMGRKTRRRAGRLYRTPAGEIGRWRQGARAAASDGPPHLRLSEAQSVVRAPCGRQSEPTLALAAACRGCLARAGRRSASGRLRRYSAG